MILAGLNILDSDMRRSLTFLASLLDNLSRFKNSLISESL